MTNVTDANHSNAGIQPYQFTVTYQADTQSDPTRKIDFHTIDGNDVTVTGPNGLVSPVTVVNPPTASAATLTVTYQITPPGGTWDSTDDGFYTVAVVNGQVRDDNPALVGGVPGTPAPSGDLKTFSVAMARSIVVTTLNDTTGGPGLSLRDAINLANSGPSTQDVISFAPSLFTPGPQTLTLESELPVIFDGVTITGPGAKLLKIQNDVNALGFRPLYLNGPGSINVTISKLEISGGNAGSFFLGGAIFKADENLTLDSVLLDNNAAGSGGAIGGFGGSLTIRNSTLSGNTSTDATSLYYYAGGGAIFEENGGQVLIQNSTITGNQAANSGGAIYGGYWSGAVTIQNSTITGNNAVGNGGAVMLYNYLNAPARTGTVTLLNSIVSGNNGPATGKDFFVLTVTATFSAIGSTGGYTLGAGSANNLSTADANSLNLQPLGDYGGPTPTMALGLGSKALNAGPTTSTETTDQRGVGYVRTYGAKTDIGAVEAQIAVSVNDGSAQRSLVTSMTVSFDGLVGGVTTAGAFQLARYFSPTGDPNGNVGLTVTDVTPSGSLHTVVLLTFSGSLTETSLATLKSLQDGLYKLTVFGGLLTDQASGMAVDADVNGTAGGNYVSADDTIDPNTFVTSGPKLYRYYGDVTGDYNVAAQDFNQFKVTFGSDINDPDQSPPYNPFFDFNGDGFIAAFDFNQFKTRFGNNVFNVS